MLFGKNYLKYSFAFFLLVSAWGLIYTNVPTSISLADRLVFTRIGLNSFETPVSFEEEIALIRKVQTEVFKRAPLDLQDEGIPLKSTREPADLVSAGHGLCYDRSRTLDKALVYVGFETRHIYVLYKENRSLFDALSRHGQKSHAVTEVETSKGWLFVDSNTPWIAMNKIGQPIGADEVWSRLDEFEDAPEYLGHPYWAIRGMYSRNGYLYPPYISIPEFNYPDFLNWIITDFFDLHFS